MANYDEWGVIIPAPATGYMGEARYDDDHRGPGVSEAYPLSRCWIDLAEHSRKWAAPTLRCDDLEVLAGKRPESERAVWLKDAVNRREAERLLSYAIQSGQLPIWVAPKDRPETSVPPESILELDHATLASGTYRPLNDRGWLFGRPLFVKRKDWVRFIRSTNRAKTPGTEAFRFGASRKFTRDDPATVSPWWSVNQTLAWIATRITSYVEHVGEMETRLFQREPRVMVYATIREDLESYQEPEQIAELADATWPKGKLLARAGRLLLASIKRGMISPAILEEGKGRVMAWHEFAGLGASETGQDWLDLHPQPLFSSEEVMQTFPVPSLAARHGGKIGSNRQLDHTKIIERAQGMLEERPNLSKGSAAASIVAELPRNPKTGKPRDQRGIERIIAPLWEGKTR